MKAKKPGTPTPHEEFLTKLDTWSAEWSRVLRQGGNFAIFCADTYISHLIEALKKNNLSPRRLIVWRKSNAVPVNRAHMPMSANEYIIVGVKGSKATFNADVPIINQTIDDKIIESTIVADKVSTILYSRIKEQILATVDDSTTDEEHLEYIKATVKGVLKSSEKEVIKKTLAMYKTDKDGQKHLQACVPNYVQNPIKVGNRLHPTEKPVSLLQYLIALYSKPGDLVLDGFGGSGSSGEAALTLGRSVVIVERDAKFFEKLNTRLIPQANPIEVIEQETGL